MAKFYLGSLDLNPGRIFEIFLTFYYDMPNWKPSTVVKGYGCISAIHLALKRIARVVQLNPLFPYLSLCIGAPV